MVILWDALNKAKQFELDFAKSTLAKHQQRGEFPKSTKSYQTVLIQKGGGRKRQLSTIQPRFMQLPNTIRFINQDAANILSFALAFVQQAFDGVAPVKTGRYKESLLYFWMRGNSRKYVSRSPQYIIAANDKKPFDVNDRIMIMSALPYSSTLESNYYTRRKKKLMFGIAEMLADKFGDDRISVDFRYRSGIDFGVSHKGELIKYALPIITIGIGGAFNNKLVTPGQRVREGRSKAKKKTWRTGRRVRRR